jgi:uncharacterized membrane protein YfcA
LDIPIMDVSVALDPLLLLFLAAGVAGFIDAIAGGGGLITLPALLLAQIPAVNALATNKLQGSFGTFASSLTMLRKGKVELAQIRVLFLSSLIGSSLGALLLLEVDPTSLDLVVPLALAAIALSFALQPKAGERETAPRIGVGLYRMAVVPAIGFYDGLFGPGSGSLFSASAVFLRGQSLVTATATAKVLNFSANIASLVIFIGGRKVLWSFGAVMIAGNMLGAHLGALAAIGGGARLIRPVIVAMCLIMLARYVWQRGLLGF